MILVFCLLVIVILIIVGLKVGDGLSDCSIIFTEPQKIAGNEGEQYATSRVIEKALWEGDRLLTNVSFEYDGKRVEIDDLIINDYGIFIIEVKTYVGEIIGNENDDEWVKIKTTDAGNDYEKVVRNPLPQIRWQTSKLSKYLKYHGLYGWIEGYAYFVYSNSPIRHPRILRTRDEISKAIHTATKNKISKDMQNKIYNLLR